MQIKYNNLFNDDLISWIRLSRTVSESTFYSMLQIYESTHIALEKCIEITNKKSKIFNIPSISSIKKEIEATQNFGAEIVTIYNAKYSNSLKLIKDAPPTLIVKGNTRFLQQKTASIIGSRLAGKKDCELASNIALTLSEKGFNITSGLALGIDTSANKIIEQNCCTTAVLGTGINIAYPIANKELQEKISLEGGLLITESNFNSNGSPKSFIKRNRIISGMSSFLIAIDVSHKSGSFNTVKTALAQGKKVFIKEYFTETQKNNNDIKILLKDSIQFNSYTDFLEKFNMEKYEDHYEESSIDNRFNDYKNNSYSKYEYPIEKIKLKILERFENNSSLCIDNLYNTLEFSYINYLEALIELELQEQIIRTEHNIIIKT